MPQVTMEIRKKDLDEATQEMISGLEKSLRSEKSKNAKLKTKIARLESKLSHRDALVDKAQKIIAAVKEAGEFYSEEEIEEARCNGYC